jgi:hypothetical protein
MALGATRRPIADFSYELERLQQARELATLGLDRRTLSRMTGFKRQDLRRMFPDVRAGLGRAHQAARMFQKTTVFAVEASVFMVVYSEIHERGVPPVPSFLAAYRIYADRVSPANRRALRAAASRGSVPSESSDRSRGCRLSWCAGPTALERQARSWDLPMPFPRPLHRTGAC